MSVIACGCDLTAHVSNLSSALYCCINHLLLKEGRFKCQQSQVKWSGEERTPPSHHQRQTSTCKTRLMLTLTCAVLGIMQVHGSKRCTHMITQIHRFITDHYTHKDRHAPILLMLLHFPRCVFSCAMNIILCDANQTKTDVEGKQSSVSNCVFQNSKIKNQNLFHVRYVI